MGWCSIVLLAPAFRELQRRWPNRRGASVERKKASDFPQELLDLFDGYVHGGMSRREFLDGAQKFAVGGVTAAALLNMLKPNYAWAIQVPTDDKRIKTEYATVASPQGNGSFQGLPSVAGDCHQTACRSGHPRESWPQSLYRRCSATAGGRQSYRVCARWTDIGGWLSR